MANEFRHIIDLLNVIVMLTPLNFYYVEQY